MTEVNPDVVSTMLINKGYLKEVSHFKDIDKSFQDLMEDTARLKKLLTSWDKQGLCLETWAFFRNKGFTGKATTLKEFSLIRRRVDAWDKVFTKIKSQP